MGKAFDSMNAHLNSLSEDLIIVPGHAFWAKKIRFDNGRVRNLEVQIVLTMAGLIAGMATFSAKPKPTSQFSTINITNNYFYRRN